MLCDIGYVIKDHVPAMMQIMTNHITSYNMQFLTTKCLNTAVMMWYLFLGTREDVLDVPHYCDSDRVVRRGRSSRASDPAAWEENALNPMRVARALRRELTAPQDMTQGCVRRRIFYVMMTSGNLRWALSKEEGRAARRPPSLMFPGHVFVIEKVGGGRNRFNLFQSFINRYTLDGHAVFNRSFAVSQTVVEGILAGIERMYTEPAWSADTTRFWKSFTHVDSPEYEGYNFRDNSFMCFNAADTTNCVLHMKTFLEAKRAELLPHVQSAMDAVYGRAESYKNTDNTALRPLTNREMLEEIDAILRKI